MCTHEHGSSHTTPALDSASATKGTGYRTVVITEIPASISAYEVLAQLRSGVVTDIGVPVSSGIEGRCLRVTFLTQEQAVEGMLKACERGFTLKGLARDLVDEHPVKYVAEALEKHFNLSLEHPALNTFSVSLERNMQDPPYVDVYDAVSSGALSRMLLIEGQSKVAHPALVKSLANAGVGKHDILAVEDIKPGKTRFAMLVHLCSLDAAKRCLLTARTLSTLASHTVTFVPDPSRKKLIDLVTGDGDDAQHQVLDSDATQHGGQVKQWNSSRARVFRPNPRAARFRPGFTSGPESDSKWSNNAQAMRETSAWEQAEEHSNREEAAQVLIGGLDAEDGEAAHDSVNNVRLEWTMQPLQPWSVPNLICL